MKPFSQKRKRIITMLPMAALATAAGLAAAIFVGSSSQIIVMTQAYAQEESSSDKRYCFAYFDIIGENDVIKCTDTMSECKAKREAIGQEPESFTVTSKCKQEKHIA
jgi:flagellar basal body-associated protein FliL